MYKSDRYSIGCPLVLEAIGVVWLSQGLKQIGELREVTAREVLRLVGKGATNQWLLLGVFFETIFFVTLFTCLRTGM